MIFEGGLGALRGMSELAVIVLPFAAWRDRLYRVPVFDDLSVGNPEEIVETGVDTAACSFAHAENEIAFSENLVKRVITDCEIVAGRGREGGPKGRDPIGDIRIVLDQAIVCKMFKPVELPADQHLFNEGPDERPVRLGPVKIGNLDFTIQHCAARGIGSSARLNIIPMFNRLAVFEPEDFECHSEAGKIILIVGKRVVPVLKDADKGDTRIRFRQPGKECR